MASKSILSLFIVMSLCFLKYVGAQTNSPPDITNLPATITLSESVAIGTSIFQLSVDDPDDPLTENGTYSCNIRYDETDPIVGNQDRRFSIDASTCVVFIAQPLDYETFQTYNLLCGAEDLAGGLTRKKLTVTVSDVNDNKPSCSSYTVFGALDEEEPVGTKFAQLNCGDPDTKAGGQLVYRVVPGTGAISEIDVDPNTGEMIINRTIDYDSEPHTFQAEVEVADKGTPRLSTLVTVILSLNDIDDQPPKFSQATYTIDVDEDAAIGTTILKLPATDGDAPDTPASTITFDFVGGGCNPDQLMLDRFTGSLFVKQALDYETHPLITCPVLAYSSNNMASGTTATVSVMVRDVNDGVPTFSQNFYQVNISESATKNQSVIQVIATDPDSGPDGDVLYSIEPGLFDVNPVTGDVTVLNDTLDYETATSYLLMINATDQGTPAMWSSVYLQISVLPVNEYRPALVGPFSVSIPENTAPGTSVLLASARDDDAGLDGLVTYKLLTKGVPFIVDTGSGVIRATSGLDYEKTRMYQLVVQAIDSSTTQRLTSSASYTVSITDVNDLAVTCLPSTTAVIKYQFPIGNKVTKINCTDPDAIPTTLTYNITSGNDEGAFSIGKNSGEIWLQARPQSTNYTLEIDVTDGVDTTSTSIIILSEQVLELTNLPDNISITEEGPSQILYTAMACCAFPRIRFSIVAGNSDGRVVIVDSTGEIQLNVPYDRETQENYNYMIKVTSDSGQTATATLQVTVTDINDHQPVFAAGVYAVTVDENLFVGTVISRYAATDQDKGVNADLTYKITSGDPGGQFNIGSVGDLTLAAALDYETQMEYTLVIESSDSGTPARTGTTTVLVKVQNHDEYPPALVPMPGPYTETLSEDVALGTSVFVLNATDQDAGSTFTYSIDNGNTNGDFAIDPKGGYIYVAKLLDRERTAAYSLNLTATNQNGQSVSGTLDIKVDDVNDNNPQFSSNVYTFDVYHDTNVGVTVGVVAVSDMDEGSNSKVNVVIQSGNTGGAFDLNGLDLETKIVMDYQKVQRYRLVLKATDMGLPARTATAIVVINVLPPATVQPEYAVKNATVTLQEDQSIGFQVYDLDATNLGAVEDGSIVYTIMSGNINADFSVRADTGQVVIAKSLDYERTPDYTLVIQAANQAGTLTDDFTLTVLIINLNDNSPEFSQGSYSFEVDEMARYDYSVGQVLATDGDTGSYGDVTTTMTGSTDFKIEADTGIIKVNGGLDYQKRSVYSYVVIAKDGDRTNPKSAQASVVIRIRDINNNAPVFVSGAIADVPDSAPVNSEFFRVHATDRDTGAAGNVSYRITNDPSLGKFNLDPYSGILSTNDLLDAAKDPMYVLTVMAIDAGSSRLNTTMDLTINVIATNPNNHDPIFTDTSPLSVIVDRQEAPGYVVVIPSATDDDYGPSGEIVYKITAGNSDGYFIIDISTSSITTAAKLLEAANSYSLTVVAMDRGNPSRNATLQVDITISPPVTTSITVDYRFSVAENEPVGYPVGMIPTDGGRTVNMYTIQSGNLNNAFAIAPDGTLTIDQKLDFETYPIYSLEIDADTDIGVFTKIAQIDVTDVNDEPPVFTASSFTFNVAENSPVGMSIGTVSYTDDDTDPSNTDNTLTIMNPGASLFSIDQSGVLRVKAVLDYETIGSPVTFDAVVADNQPPLTSVTAVVTVNIIDVEETEEKSPSTVTDDAMISLEVYYQAPIGHVIHTLVPGDFGLNSTAAAIVEFVSYDTNDPFSINSITGDITVSGPMEDQTTYYHWVSIHVVEGGITSVRAALLRIDTFDKNKYIIVIEFSEPLATVQNSLYSFQQRTQAFFNDPRRVGFTHVFTSGTTGRRRLLAESTAAYTYVVSDSSVDEMANVNQPKSFLTEEQMLDVLQLNADGTPVGGLSDSSGSGLEVSKVEPFQETEESDDGIEEFATSAPGIVVFVLLGVLLLATIVLTVVCLLHRKNKKQGRPDESNRRNEARERRERERY